jgi:glutamine synthetase adenylyltransferase
VANNSRLSDVAQQSQALHMQLSSLREKHWMKLAKSRMKVNSTKKVFKLWKFPKTLWMRINWIDISRFLKLPPVKRHCSLLAEEAINAALEDFKTKNKATAE